MRILSIVWYKVLPPIYGGQKGIALFNQYLARHADITCLCSRDNQDSVPYRLIPELPVGKKQFFNPSCWSLIRKTAREQQSTHIILEHPYHGIGAVKAIKDTGARLVVHSHNIESARFRQLGKPGWQLLAQYEKWVHRKASLSLFKTEKEKCLAIEKFGLKEETCLVVPFGIEPLPSVPVSEQTLQELRQSLGIGSDDKVLLFAGTLDYSPNANAVRVIYENIAPALDKMKFNYKILICGRIRFSAFQYLKKFEHRHIKLLIDTRDMELLYAMADVFINPVLEGGGIQTKNIEAISRNCPVVAFEEMVDDSISKYAQNMVFTVRKNDWAGFAGLIPAASVCRDRTPAAFFHFFSWERITTELAERLART